MLWQVAVARWEGRHDGAVSAAAHGEGTPDMRTDTDHPADSEHGGLSRRTVLLGLSGGLALAGTGLGPALSASAATLLNGRWCSPARGRLSSAYGWRTLNGVRAWHAGWDVANPVGTAVYAAAAGTVVRRGWNVVGGRTGNGIVVSHGSGVYTYYGHLNAFRVGNGASVSAGQRIADMGATGNVTGPHLHFEVQIGGIGKDVNPRTHLTNRGAVLGGGWPTLDPEARGQRVKAMQFLLRQRGRSITVDGYHGSQSTATLKAWQRAVKLVGDGQAGPKTWPVLDYVLRQGHGGDHVRALQTLLNKHSAGLLVDGDFGGVTNTAVKSFQGLNNLVKDGEAGPITWQAALS
ncbi:peptidoglycan DD-metalloendopeptidase family protein [Ornithinimicrobium faecis]|uniref:Peptidoglycan DD-metalloendopeptidase family protein n=1 Tax=Ornithinimicrobium faecis TaxID=2934158 RepID=A0ABY4YU10_9MICO|nr:peptidoglycan DD-metalloendopeptidase family protein [Ornithinimicrobium sp. HY1793]USQ80261.1 peptidoglycan DD-metalloendopeptidase family protein [Ornithinimicrobium sp. HY1793]